MIVVDIERDAQREICAFTVTGHAGCAPHGQDIVCAAVSILTQTAVLAVQKLGRVEPYFRMESGRLVFRLPHDTPGSARPKVSVILETMLLGLQEVAAVHRQAVRVKIRGGGSDAV